ncbi:serine/threonine-protein kinase [Polyangium aurulentum]|uniref:serine/threonine-protein kinase n=1 Tax=Polyangium aurulentum TaxID=2567896 RepID=UPI0010ADDFE4|nr:serine/threonine-protein kinase [Polyangium aurulentum]UQA60762.1 protein kinase [Polyangium aurulentum]
MLGDNAVFAGRYRIIRRLAAGGMGEVYEAVHLETDRPCALKIMLPHLAESPALRERFRLEARAAARIESEHVVGVLDAGMDEASGAPFLVMELLRGEDLSRRMKRSGRLSVAEVASTIAQAARGLDALHRAGIVHRDLKPSNLFLVERAEGPPRIKVLDLGVAKRMAETAAAANTASVGTPFYMAPEQLRSGKISPATDVYALGMVAYTLLVGREYWAAEAQGAESSLAFALATLDGPKERATARAAAAGVVLPEGFDAWFARATAGDPGERFERAIDAAEALVAALGIEGAGEPALEAQPAKDEAARSDAPAADTGTRTEIDAPFAATRTATLAEADVTDPKETQPRVESSTASPGATAPSPPRAPTRSRALPWAAGALLLALIGGSAWLARTRSQAPEVTPTPPTLPVVTSLACAPATLSGHDPSPSLARALGLGACARLAIELGVDWPTTDRLAPLEVTAELRRDGGAKVTLALKGQTASAEGATPIAATNDAIAALSPKLATQPFSATRIGAWGAKDEASARRIQRAFRRQAFGFAADPKAEAQRLVETDPESPIAHAMLAFTLPRHEEAAWKARVGALEKISALPPGRAHAIEGHLRTFIDRPGEEDRSGRGIALIRQSYGELAEDPDVAGFFASGGCFIVDELFPMLDRVTERHPALGLPLARCALYAASGVEQVDRAIDRINAGLPEIAARHVGWLLEAGRIDEARVAVELGRRLGLESVKRADIAHDRARLALAVLDPKTALSAADEALGDPDPRASSEGAQLRVSALLSAGRVTDALDVLIREFYRRRDGVDAEDAAWLLRDEMRLRRLLAQSPIGDDRRQWLAGWLASEARKERFAVPDIQAEVALAGATRPSKPAAVKALDAIEADAIEARVDTPGVRDWLFAASLPLVRIARGDAAVASSWERLRAKDDRERAAFEAALALEALRRPDEAEKAYRLAMAKPWERPFESMAARVRLADLLRAAGREEEAREHDAAVDRAWANADPGLRDAVRRMK